MCFTCQDKQILVKVSNIYFISKRGKRRRGRRRRTHRRSKFISFYKQKFWRRLKYLKYLSQPHTSDANLWVKYLLKLQILPFYFCGEKLKRVKNQWRSLIESSMKKTRYELLQVQTLNILTVRKRCPYEAPKISNSPKCLKPDSW